MNSSTMLMLTVIIFGNLLLAVKGKTTCISHPVLVGKNQLHMDEIEVKPKTLAQKFMVFFHKLRLQMC